MAKRRLEQFVLDAFDYNSEVVCRRRLPCCMHATRRVGNGTARGVQRTFILTTPGLRFRDAHCAQLGTTVCSDSSDSCDGW